MTCFLCSAHVERGREEAQSSIQSYFLPRQKTNTNPEQTNGESRARGAKFLHPVSTTVEGACGPQGQRQAHSGKASDMVMRSTIECETGTVFLILVQLLYFQTEN